MIEKQAIFFGLLIFFGIVFRIPIVRHGIDALFSNPVLLRKVAGWLVVISVIEWAEAKIMGWVGMVEYVSHLSQLAITISLIPWWQGLRVEERQVEQDIPNEVVEAIVSQTDVEPTSSEKE